MSDRYVTDEVLNAALTAGRAEYRRSFQMTHDPAVARLVDSAVESALAAATPLLSQRLSRAAFAVDSKHHFHEREDGIPVCSCGFEGDSRKRTQTEHITAAVIEEYPHD